MFASSSNKYSLTWLLLSWLRCPLEISNSVFSFLVIILRYNMIKPCLCIFHHNLTQQRLLCHLLEVFGSFWARTFRCQSLFTRCMLIITRYRLILDERCQGRITLNSPLISPWSAVATLLDLADRHRSVLWGDLGCHRTAQRWIPSWFKVVHSCLVQAIVFKTRCLVVLLCEESSLTVSSVLDFGHTTALLWLLRRFTFHEKFDIFDQVVSMSFRGANGRRLDAVIDTTAMVSSSLLNIVLGFFIAWMEVHSDLTVAFITTSRNWGV